MNIVFYGRFFLLPFFFALLQSKFGVFLVALVLSHIDHLLVSYMISFSLVLRNLRLTTTIEGFSILEF
jgi:hypothetical protein